MNISDPNSTNAVTLVSAAVGAFLGSASAFGLEAWRRCREERNTKYASLFKAQLIVLGQLNTLLNIKQQYLDAHRDDPQRFMKLGQFHTALTDQRINYGELWFVPLLRDNGVFHTVHIAEQGYVTATDTLTLRNRKVEETMYAADVKVGAFEFSSGRAVVEIDARKARLLKSITDALYGSVDDAIRKQELVVRDIRKLIKMEFPGQKSIDYQGPA